MTQSKSQQDQAAEKTPPLEWAFAAIGAVLIMCTIGYMIYYGFTHPDSPPDLTVSHTATHVLPGGYLVQFTAKNEGNSTASGVLVSGTLVRDDGAVEESEVTLDYVPQQAQRDGGLVFKNDPSTSTFRLQVRGYFAP